LAEGGVKYYELDAAQLENHRVKPSAPGARSRTLVSCGQVGSGPWEIEVQIVNPDTLEVVAPSEVGEIWVGGDLVTKGYWNRPAETEKVFYAQIRGIADKYFLRSGDLGFRDGRELVFTGRRKDLIIVEGRNHYPQDIEKAAEKSHPALRPGCSIAFSVDSEGPVQVVLVCELSRGYCLRGQAAAPTDIQVAGKELEAAIRREVSEEHQIRVHDIVVIPTNTIPKTSSGKLQRSGCKARYLDGSLVRSEAP